MATQTFTFVDIFKSTQASNTAYSFLNVSDRSVLAWSCKSCLTAFIEYLQNLPKDQQLMAKSMALNPLLWLQNIYPLSYLNELKNINAAFYPSDSPELQTKVKKAFYDEDRVTLRLLIDFGVDASHLMDDVLRWGFVKDKKTNRMTRTKFHIEPDMLEIVFSSKTLDLNYSFYRRKYPIILAALFLDKFEIWEVLQGNENINWNFKDREGRNVAYWATCSYSENLLKFLEICKAKKVNFEERDKYGNRACLIAVKHRKLDALKYLVEECNVDVNAQNDTGITVGHEICERGYG
eukprot:255161_1